jgi:plastocyanin
MVGKAGALVALTIFFAIPVSTGLPVEIDTHVVTREAPGLGFQYVPADLVVDVSGTLTLTNTDLAGHDIVSVADGPESNPWCERFPARTCPLFASPMLGLGEQGQVEGIDALPRSDPLGTVYTYEYYCSVHPWMTGTITTI